MWSYMCELRSEGINRINQGRIFPHITIYPIIFKAWIEDASNLFSGVLKKFEH